MSMSTSVVGLISEDNPEYQKHIEIVEFCKKMEVSLPKETEDYFDLSEVKQEYWHNYIDEKRHIEIPHRDYYTHNERGVEIDVKDIPQGAETIRFYNSW